MTIIKKIKTATLVTLSTALDIVLTLAAVIVLAVLIVPAFSVQDGKARYKRKVANV